MKTDYVKHRIANILNIQKIVTMHYFEFECDFNFKGESHDFWELVYADKGLLSITAGGRKFTLSQGDVISTSRMNFIFTEPTELLHRMFLLFPLW